MVAYVLGITYIDPLEHDLYFERFLSPARDDPPDIDLDVVAEGIEHADQLLTLESMGCPFGQGYLLGRPGPLDDVVGRGAKDLSIVHHRLEGPDVRPAGREGERKVGGARPARLGGQRVGAGHDVEERARQVGRTGDHVEKRHRQIGMTTSVS